MAQNTQRMGRAAKRSALYRDPVTADLALTFALLTVASAAGVIVHAAIRRGRLQRGERCGAAVSASSSFRSDLVYNVVGNAVFAAALIGSMRWTSGPASLSPTLLYVALLIVLHDLYFYWCHRLLHVRFLIGFHNVHHRSAIPTPLSAMAMHPIEATLEALFLPLTALTLHPPAAAFVAFFWFMIAANTIGHLGIRGVPVLSGRPGLLKWIAETDGHLQHHLTPNRNFGAYLSLWDAWFGTASPKRRP